MDEMNNYEEEHYDSELIQEFAFLGFASEDELSPENSLIKWCWNNGERGKRLIDEWDQEKNSSEKGYPFHMRDIAAKSQKKVWWKCSLCGSSFNMSVAARTHCNYNCSVCAHKRGGEKNRKNAAENYNLTDWCRDNGKYGEKIMAEWADEKDISSFSFGSSYIAKWKCQNCNEIFTAKIFSRINSKQSCPHCNRAGTSYPEKVIYFSMKQLWPESKSRYKMYGMEYDIFIPEKRCCIEFNGSFWHKDKKERDDLKRQLCEEHFVKFFSIDSGEYDKEIYDGTYIRVISSCQNIEKQLMRIVKYIVEKLDGEYEKIDFDKATEKASKIMYEPVQKNLVEIESPLVKEWIPELNKGLKPEYFTAGSHKMIKWQCSKCGGTWKASIRSRQRFQTGCVYCRYCVFDNTKHRPNNHNNKNRILKFI